MADAASRLNEALSGRYSIERQLGEGGMATVYLARDLRHDRSVALKVLKPELAAVVGAERFLAEIRTTANLQHPHILPLFDSGEADGMLFYVMPHVEGESLRERLDRERQLPVDEAVRVATNVAEALDYAHSRGVIHRDIKPANILLQAGKPIVSDFGIALAVSAGGGGRLTETGLSLGTPHYMSPEQATGDMHVGHATDVYALGCVLYEMLVGEPPYTGSTPQAVLGRIITGEAPSARKQRSTVPAHVDAAIRRALERVPADRFASAGALARALGEPTFRHGPRGPEHSAAGLGRGRGAALALVGAVAGALLATLVTGRERTGPTAGVMRFPLLEAGSAVRRGPMQPDVAIAPDGRTVAYVGAAPDGPSTQLYLRSIGEMSAVALVGTEGAQFASFSPDGRWIAFVDDAAQATLRRVSVTGGVAETLASLDSVGYIAGVTWESSERLVVGTGSGTGLFRVTVGGAIEHLALGQYHWPTYVAGREAVIFLDHANSELHLATLDLRSGEVSPLGVQGTAPRYLPSGHLVFVAPDGRLAAARFDAAALALLERPVTLPEVVDLKSATEGGASFDVSGEGTLVFIPGGSDVPGTQLLRIERDGSSSPVATIDGDAGYPRLSPDGSRLAVAIGNDLWVIDLERGARTRVTFAGSNRFIPLWAPDGSRLTHADGADAQNRVLLTAADGSGRQDTLLALGPRTFPTSWSVDGRTLALTAGPIGGPRDIHTLVRDGARSEVVPYVQTPFSERGAVFSPDGRWVAYVSNKSGRDEIYVRPAAGSGTETTVSLEGGGEPAWSRSGNELFYRGASRFFVVSVASTAGGVSIGQPRALFPDTYRKDSSALAAYANYEVLPSGELLVIADAEGPTSGTIQIALDWTSELRERVPN